MAILLETRSDSKQAQADLAKLKDSVNNIQTSVEKTTEKFGLLAKTVAAGFAAFSTTSSILKLSDELTNLETKLRLVTDTQEEFNRALGDVRKIAIGTRSDLYGIATLYSKLSRSSKDFGANQTQVARVTDLISKSLATANATVQETNSAILQLSQGLASGVLAGDELRAVLESAPPLAEAIAKGMGKTVGQLRKLGEEGKLTSVAVFQAILKQQNEIEKGFSKVKITFGAAFLNLKQSLVILFDELKKSAFGTTSSFAETINNIALSIFNFATNLKLNLLKARIAITSFVLDAIFLFYDLADILKKTGQDVGEFANNLYKDWGPVFQKLANDIRDWAALAVGVVSGVASALFDAIVKTDFGGKLVNYLKSAFNKVSEVINSSIQYVYSKLPKIEVSKIFPGLDIALNQIKNWAIQAERWFFWLYDKVIGNSWIPDLVKDTTKWLAQLLAKPLSIIKDFVLKSNSSFAKISFSAPLLASISLLLKYKTVLISILGVVGLIGAALASLGVLSKSGTIDLQAPKTKTEEYTKKTLTWLEKLYKETKESFDKSNVGRTIKQVLGMPDRTPGEIFGVNIDTREQARVGRGPFRMDEIRFPGHDILNAFPPNWQVPVITAITGIFGIAIIRAFEAGTTRSVLLSVLTTAAGIFAANTVDPSVLKRSFGNAAFSFVEILEKGITALFSGNVLKDPLGVLSIIAKTSLLFEEGRRAIGQALLGIGTAPTRGAQTVSDLVQRRLLRQDVASTNRELNTLPQRLNQAFLDNRRESQAALARLAGTRDAYGNVIGQNRAQLALQTGNVNMFGTDQARRATQEAILAQRNLDVARQNLTTIGARQTELRAASEESQRRLTQISERLTQQADAFRQGFQNIFAGAGGILGGLAGFQIGTEIAKGMTDSPGWVKVGVALATSFAGQAIGATIGLIAAQSITTAFTAGSQLISTGVSTAFSTVSRLLTNPFITAGLVIAAAIATVLNWDTLTVLFKAFGDLWTKYITPLLNQFISKLEELVNRIRGQAGQALDQPATTIAGKEVSKREVAAGGITATVVAGILGLVARFTSIFDGVIASARNASQFLSAQFTSIINSARASYNLAIWWAQNYLPGVAQLQAGLLAALNNIRATLPAWVGTAGAAFAALIAGVFGSPVLTAALITAAVGALSYGIYKLVYGTIETIAPSSSGAQIPGAVPGQVAPQGRANGGGIRGPGTGTSDSIPAMLSNGEFVVNAKDAKKNWALLTAINSGQEIAKFAKGTETTKKKAPVEFYENKEKLKQLFTERLSEKYNLPKEPYNRLLAAEYYFYSNFSKDPLNYRARIRDIMGLSGVYNKPEDIVGKDASKEDLERIRAAVDTSVNGAINEIVLLGSSRLSGNLALTATLGKLAGGPIGAVTALGQFLDQAALPISAGLLRGYRFFNGSGLFGKGAGDSLLKSFEEMPLGLSAKLTKPISDLLTKSVEFISNPSENTLKDILSIGTGSNAIDRVLEILGAAIWKYGIYPLVEVDEGLAQYLSQFAYLNRDRVNFEEDSLIESVGSRGGALNPNLYPLKKKSAKDPRDILSLSPEAQRKAIGPQDTFIYDLIYDRKTGLPKYATGGFIKGPGTGTSDSIPAMLSNGEFVVNAKDAQKNWQLLTAINSGHAYQGFYSGTAKEEIDFLARRYPQNQMMPLQLRYPESIPPGYSRADLNPLETVLSNFTDSFKSITSKFDEIVKKLKLDEVLGLAKKTTPKGVAEEKTLVDAIENAPNIKDAAAILNKTLTSPSFGFKNIDIKGLEAQDPQVLQSVAKIAEDIRRQAEKTSKLPEGSIGRQLAQELVDQNRQKLAELLDSYKIVFEKPGNLKPAPVEGKTKITLGDQLKLINEAFPKLNLSATEFNELSNDALRTLFINAVKVKKSISDLESKEIGSLEGGLKLSDIPKNLQEQRAALQTQAAGLQDIAFTIVNPLRNSFQILEGGFKEIGVNLSREAYNNFSDFEKQIVTELQQNAIEALATVKAPEGTVDADTRRRYEEIFAKIVRDLNTMITKAATLGLNTYEKSKAAFGEFNINLDEITYNLLSSLEKQTLASYLESLRRNKFVEGMTDAQRQQVQRNILEITTNVTKFLAERAPTYKSDAKKAGESFAEGIAQTLSTSLSDVLKSKKVSAMGVLKDILNSFTSSIIDTFVKGIMSPLTGEKGIITRFGNMLGESLFSLGTKSIPNSLIGKDTSNNLVSSAVDSAVSGETKPKEGDDTKGILATIVSKFTEGFNFIGEFFKTLIANGLQMLGIESFKQAKETAVEAKNSIWQAGVIGWLSTIAAGVWADAAIPFASGGIVRGPGSGTSDSISAMLSNGEFVVNAKATRKHLGLLQAINSGDIKKYAAGGLVSTAMIATPAMAEAKPLNSSNNSQQVININITGDISRQTRAQIYQMLPSIAEGVNAQNRERGYRG